MVNTVSSPQGQKEKLENSAPGGIRDKGITHSPSDTLSYRASCAPNPAYALRRELMDGICEAEGGESKRLIAGCRRELELRLTLGVRNKDQLQSRNLPNPCAIPTPELRWGFLPGKGELRFPLSQPFPPAPPLLLLSITHWIRQCLSPSPAHAHTSNQLGSKK